MCSTKPRFLYLFLGCLIEVVPPKQPACSVCREAEVQLVSSVKNQVHKFENVDPNHIIISSREMS